MLETPNVHITLDMAISEWKYQLVDNKVVRRRDKQGPVNNMAIRGGKYQLYSNGGCQDMGQIGPGNGQRAKYA